MRSRLSAKISLSLKFIAENVNKRGSDEKEEGKIIFNYPHYDDIHCEAEKLHSFSSIEQ